MGPTPRSQNPGSFRESPPWSPLRLSLRTSASTCSITGDPPFTVTLVYRNIATRPIWALISLFSDAVQNVQIRDPNHPKGSGARIGCYSTRMCDDEDIPHHVDAHLVRLDPRDEYHTSYTFRVHNNFGFHKRDTHFLTEGGNYFVASGIRKYWWIDALSIDGLTSSDEKRDAVVKVGEMIKWYPASSCSVAFKAVA